MKFIFLVVLISCFLMPIMADRDKGTINSNNLYDYISKFCFSKGTKTVDITFQTSVANGLKLGVMDISAFKKLNNKLSCAQIEALTSQHFPITNNQPLQFTLSIPDTQWWYLIAYTCDSKLSLSYDVTFLNGGGFWQNQFSYDEQGLGQLYVSYTVFYAIALGLHIFGVMKLRADNSYHEIVKMVTISFVVEWFATFLLSIHYGVFARNGVGVFSFLFIGQIMDLVGDLLMILLVTLIAQGFAKNTLSVTKQKITFLILGINLVIYVAMDIWKIAGIAHSSVNYLYDTAPGGIILTIRMLLFLYFLYAILTTIREEQIQQKISFYKKFAVFSSVWFCFLPFFALIALGMASYRRLVFISAVFTTLDFLAFVGLGILMWPKFIHDYFVVRQVESQVDFSESEDRDDL